MGTVLPFATPNGNVGVAAKRRDVVPYPFDARFEADMVTALCRRPLLWAQLADFIEIEALTGEVSRRAFGAARDVFRETGRAPSSLLEVIQCLRRQVDKGKLEIERVTEVSDYFDDALDRGLSDDSGIIGQVKPILQRRAERAAIDNALGAYAAHEDVVAVFSDVERVKRIGESTSLEEALMGAQGIELIDRSRHVARLKTGIYELDAVLGGGVRRGTSGMFLGEGSAGKSVALTQVAVAGAVQGIPTAYATLELPAATVHARLLANLTRIPIDVILDDPKGCGVLEETNRINALINGMAPIYVADFPARATCPDDLFRWVESLQLKYGVPVLQLVVDYADKCGSGAKRARGEASSYEEFGSIYDQLFNWGKSKDKWVWTASQATRGGNRKGSVLTLDDVSDSINKTRNFDTVVTLNPTDEYTMMTFGIAKNRHGKRGAQVGPLPVEFECARIAPVEYQ